MSPALDPTPIELAAATLLGYDRSAPALPAEGGSPRVEIERLLAEALSAGPVAVLFSGGRDSSALLAIAVHVARREGLPLPIPVTNRYPGNPDAIEDAWQEQVIERLGLGDWVISERHHEHETLGEVALTMLRRHGPQAVPNWWITMLPPELGGIAPGSDVQAPSRPLATLVSGTGGDEVFIGPVRPLRAALLAGRRPSLAQLRWGRGQLLPARLQAARRWSSHAEPFDWVRAPAREQLGRAVAADIAAAPDRYDRSLDALWRLRDVRVLVDRNRVAAAESGARLLMPFLEPTVLGALGRRWGRAHPPSRAAGLEDLVGDLLPELVLTRVSKADYTSAFLGAQSFAWLEGWDGSGVDDAIVDGRRVREVLLEAARGGGRGDARATVVAQQARLRMQAAP